MKSKTIDQYREVIQEDINEIVKDPVVSSKVEVVADRNGMLRLKSDFIYGCDLVNIIRYLIRKEYRFCLYHGDIVLQ